MNTFRLVLLILSLAASSTGAAAVAETREGYFKTESVVLVDLPPAAAWRGLIRVPAWWDPEHTWSGAARNLSLDPRAGGCFCEKLSEGGSVDHARVIFAQPGKLLRMDGALGPLQEMPVTGVLTYTLAPDGPGTRITMTYAVAGAMSLDAAKLAPLVDQVLAGQLERLRNYLNSTASRTPRR